jgi:dihydroorotate dehydrogenase electron transfer subunit
VSSEANLNHNATVVGNCRICREHYRLTLGMPGRISASPGQFVHIGPAAGPSSDYRTRDECAWITGGDMVRNSQAPMLRRAFSIAGLRENGDGVEIDVIYRVVGRATHWLESVQVGDRISTLGPLGNCFAIRKDKPKAWLISGGVGLPPMLWLAEALRAASRQCVAFCGAQTADLLALTLDGSTPPAVDAARATLSAEEFTRCDVPMVISTDDGSLGYHGHIGAALTAYHEANSTKVDEIVVYTCGPERMMRFVAEFCTVRGIECYACMERSMACGTGTCQSCVVPVRDETDPEGWRYQLCCTEGPVFKAEVVIWDPVG